MLCFVPVFRVCVWYVCCYIRKKAILYNVFAITERRDMGLAYVFGGSWNGDYVSNLPYVWYYVDVTSSFQHAREECSPIGHMYFRCLMFRFSEPCELLF